METIFSLLDLAPGGVYQAIAVTCDAGALLPHRFTLTCASTMSKDIAKAIGGLLSVALARSLRTVGVTHHRILRSPDFPPRMKLFQASSTAIA